METYTVIKADGAAGRDGVPVLSIGRVLGICDPGIRAWGQLCYTDEDLRVRLRAEE